MKNEGLGVFYNQQGQHMQQYDNFIGFNSMQATPLPNKQLTMDTKNYTMEDIF